MNQFRKWQQRVKQRFIESKMHRTWVMSYPYSHYILPQIRKPLGRSMAAIEHFKEHGTLVHSKTQVIALFRAEGTLPQVDSDHF
jgi:hypothetical protein